MGFVKSSDEIARIEQELAAPRWNGRWLSVQFLTSPETHRRLLPPPLEPTHIPMASATVGRWSSNCLGDFAGGVLNLSATYGSVTGAYPLVIYMDSEPATVFGRELFGEPKKSARLEGPFGYSLTAELIGVAILFLPLVATLHRWRRGRRK